MFQNNNLVQNIPIPENALIANSKNRRCWPGNWVLCLPTPNFWR